MMKPAESIGSRDGLQGSSNGLLQYLVRSGTHAAQIRPTFIHDHQAPGVYLLHLLAKACPLFFTALTAARVFFSESSPPA